MCSETFWKRVVVFCLTFGLGFFISDVFDSKKMPSKNVSELSPKRDTCVPVDGFVSYQNLAEKEKSEISKEQLEKIEAQKINAEPKPQLYFPERDLAKHKNLLHKEKCYDFDRPK